MYEVTHIQEVLDALSKLIEDPQGLPPASEQVILDVKSSEAGWSFRTPPGSPTSVGSRKSSTCSISSLNSSSSDSTHSPSSHQRSRSLSQPPSGAFRLSSVSSQDSGFTSQDTLFTRLPTPPPMELADQVNITSRTPDVMVKTESPSPSYPDAPCAMATWPNLQDTLQFEKAAASIAKSQRPHTISSAYERHNRPTITSHTFRPLQNGTDSQLSISGEMETCPDFPPEDFADDCSEEATPTHKAYPPPLPLRAEEMDLSAPTIPPKPRVLSQPLKRQDSQLARSTGNDPIYVNASDICSASNKPTTPVDPELSPKTSFQKSLAATLAQNAVQQKLLKETAANSSEQRIAMQSGSDEGACGGNAPPPPVRRSSAPKQPPLVPPHRTPKHGAAEGTSKESTSWNVFNESTESDDAHAQLMRALNARLDALQQAEEEIQLPVDLPPPPVELPERLPPPPPMKDLSLEIPPRQNSLRTAPVKKLPRTPDKSTLLSDLEMKFSRRDHGYKGKSDPPPTVGYKGKSDPPPAVIPRKNDAISKFHTAPRPPLETKAQRRVSQPTFSELLDQFPRNRGGSTEEAIPPKRLPLPPDRRSSLDLEHANAHRNLNFEASSRKVSAGNTDTASRVQKWLAGRGSMDVSRCREDLLGEIREGVNLRKASSDDRSAPILRHPKIKLPK